MFNKNLANTKLKPATNNTVRHTAIIRSRAAAAASGGNIKTTTTINQFNNLTTVNNELSEQLFLKKQLHLNLNGRFNDVTKPNDKQFKEMVHHSDYEKNDCPAVAIRNTGFNYYKNDDYDNNDDDEEERQNRRKQHTKDELHLKTSPLSFSSLLKSSPTALAKFNRIIDGTVPTSNKYSPTLQLQQQQQPQPISNTETRMALETRVALAYRNIVSEDDSLRMRITTKSTKTIKLSKNKNNSKTLVDRVDGEKENQFSKKITDDNQMKRNDVHYLLKQLNSFSDIEKIEIVDMQQQQQQQHQKLKRNDNDDNEEEHENIEKYSPTTRSLVLISPSSLSHKGIRRYASLYQTQNKLPTSMSQQQIPPEAGTGSAVKYYNTEQQQQQQQQRDQGVEWQQYDDYIFQSSHYLETNHFATNYRTTMVESSSHEFRPSTTTTGTSASYSSHSSVHAFDLYEMEPSSVVCKTSAQLPHQQSPNSVITSNQAQVHHPYATIHAQQPPVLGPPARRFQLQTRLTSSGVQTELTPSSLSTAATNASLAKNYNSNSSISNSCRSKSSHATSVNSSSDVVLCKRMPIFKCCYTPIDRWCERRNAALQAAATQKQQRTTTAGITAVAMEINDLNKNSGTGAGGSAI